MLEKLYFTGNYYAVRWSYDFASDYTFRYRYSFICQGTSTRRQRSELYGLRVKLPPVTTSLTKTT